MTDTSTLHDALETIASKANEDMSERDVENLFLEQGFYDILGYEGTGVDIRSEFTLPDDRRPDIIALDSSEAVTTVFEFKTTGRDLPPHESQLFGYMDDLRAEYGVLANGETIRVYHRDENRPKQIITLDSVSETEVRNLASTLEKRDFDLTDPDDVNQFLEQLDPIPLDGETELGQEHFFDTFRLEDGSPFADLVVGMMDLLHELRDEQEAKFVKGAYDFWEATYADEPDEVPTSWEPFIEGKQSLRDFMFCLESGHALLARLLLAKATEDHDFFAGTGYNGMDDYFRGLQGFSDQINPDAFPVAADNLIDDMQEQLVEGLFQDDIFIWWTDGYDEHLSRGHESGANQFEAVAGESGGVERISETTRNRFSRAVAEVFFNVLRFDFEDVEGDLLGDLYQRYFDPETRKALGEFYTPQPVVDYIMDGVEYERGVSNERLIDPSCGSGTFLVEAVERYIEDVERFEDDPDWEEHLQDLCTRPRIVGLDIHPFAVLMAQIRFVVAILPAYRKAKSQDADFTLRRLPIYRTDTLRNERKLTGTDLGDDGTQQVTFDAISEDEKDVRIPVPLPIEVDEDEAQETEDGFLIRRVRMPKYDTIRIETDVGNFGEYFAALQGVLDTVKDHMALADEFGSDFDWTYQSGVEERINQHTAQDYSGVEDFFAPYVDDMLENVRYLKEKHNDGRLFKMFEDSVLALVVKNYMEYDYVVGNPPYVSVQNLPSQQKDILSELYYTAEGQYDLYCPFYERGIDWLSQNGKLAYIAPNQYFVTEYGEQLREYILANCSISQLFDFRDSRVFEDATNYPAICVLKKETSADKRRDNTIKAVRIKSDVDEDTGRELDEQVIDLAKNHLTESRYSDAFIDIFDYPQSELTNDIWAVMPPEELEVFDKLDAASKSIGDITQAVFDGPTTGANTVFVVDVLNAEKVDQHSDIDTVEISPTGDENTFEIEAELLRPWLQGRDVKRWRPEWAGRHVILPYHIDTEENKKQIIQPEELAEKYPLAKKYFEYYEETLRQREGGRWEDSDTYWELSYPRNLPKFELRKIAFAEFANESTFLIDDGGEWYFKSAYAALLRENHREKTKEVACQLNSAPVEFFFKHIATVKAGGYYAFRSQYVSPLPCEVNMDSPNKKQLRQLIEAIGSVIDKDNKTERFPEAYLAGYDGELDYISYEWQTRRYPVNADVQGNMDGEFTVQAGRSDTITDVAMHSSDREARKRRAEYVHAAVDGRNVKSGEETTIPIPRSDDRVRELLDHLEADRKTVEETDIGELEDDIDAAVYDLFDLTEDEQEVIEEYLEVF